MKPRLLPILAALFLLVLPAWGKEGGDQYPNGAENWFAGAAPPPGHYYVNYLGYYTGQLRDGLGHAALLSGQTPAVNATFNALRFVDITHLRLLGADYGVHVIVPVVYQSVDMDGRASITDVGDLIVNPIILGWHHPQWHAVAGVDIYLPTGYYNQNDGRVSIGAHYYGFDPLLALSYMPKNGWEASTKLMYNLKTTNGATQYHSGQEFHTDYAAGKHFGNWMAGATGYALKQTTDDTVAGQVEAASSGLWSTGRRGQVVAIGPSLGFHSKRGTIFLVDWQHETLVRNRFGGDKLWFKMIVPVDSLLGRQSAR